MGILEFCFMHNETYLGFMGHSSCVLCAALRTKSLQNNKWLIIRKKGMVLLGIKSMSLWGSSEAAQPREEVYL